MCSRTSFRRCESKWVSRRVRRAAESAKDARAGTRPPCAGIRSSEACVDPERMEQKDDVRHALKSLQSSCPDLVMSRRTSGSRSPKTNSAKSVSDSTGRVATGLTQLQSGSAPHRSNARLQRRRRASAFAWGDPGDGIHESLLEFKPDLERMKTGRRGYGLSRMERRIRSRTVGHDGDVGAMTSKWPAPAIETCRPAARRSDFCGVRIAQRRRLEWVSGSGNEYLLNAERKHVAAGFACARRSVPVVSGPPSNFPPAKPQSLLSVVSIGGKSPSLPNSTTARRRSGCAAWSGEVAESLLRPPTHSARNRPPNARRQSRGSCRSDASWRANAHSPRRLPQSTNVPGQPPPGLSVRRYSTFQVAIPASSAHPRVPRSTARYLASREAAAVQDDREGKWTRSRRHSKLAELFRALSVRQPECPRLSRELCRRPLDQGAVAPEDAK